MYTKPIPYEFCESFMDALTSELTKHKPVKALARSITNAEPIEVNKEFSPIVNLSITVIGNFLQWYGSSRPKCGDGIDLMAGILYLAIGGQEDAQMVVDMGQELEVQNGQPITAIV